MWKKSSGLKDYVVCFCMKFLKNAKMLHFDIAGHCIWSKLNQVASLSTLMLFHPYVLVKLIHQMMSWWRICYRECSLQVKNQEEKQVN